MKAKIGLHVGFLACLGFLAAQFGGWVPATLFVGYVLLCEENDFLKMSALKALLVVVAANVLTFLIGAIPNILFELFDWVARIFGAKSSFSSLAGAAKFEQICNFLSWIVTTCKTVLMIVLAFMACRIKTIKLPVIDDLINKYARPEEA